MELPPEKAETLKRRQWKSFNIDRSLSTPTPCNGDTSPGGGAPPTPWTTPDLRETPWSPGSRGSRPRTNGSTDNSDSDMVSDYGQVVPALRAKLAAQGCSQSQLYLARELLIQAASSDTNPDSKLELEEKAVYWLMKAAHQGNKESLDTLRSMSAEGRGITDHNYPDLVSLQTLPSEVHLGIEIGSRMFSLLSKGYDYVTPAQLAKLPEDGMYAYPRRIQYLGKAGRLDQDELIHSACQYLQGDLPDVDRKVREFRLERCIYRYSWALSILLPALCSVYSYLNHSLSSWQGVLLHLMVAQTVLQLSTHHRVHQFKLWSSRLNIFCQSLDVAKYESLHRAKSDISLLPSVLLLHSFAENIREEEVYLVYTGLLTSFVAVVSCDIRGIGHLLVYSLTLFTEEFLSNEAQYWIPPSIDISEFASILRLCIYLWILYSAPSTVVVSILWMNLWKGENRIQMILTLSLTFLQQLLLAIKLKKKRLLLVVLLFAVASFQAVPQTPTREISGLKWSEYQASCLQSENSLSTAATCLHYSGLVVQWRGEVQSVRVEAINNIPHAFISYLPLALSSALMCRLGDQYQNCSSKSTQTARTLCVHKSQSKNMDQHCHLEKYSRYTYVVQLTMEKQQLFASNSRPLKVVCDHKFGALVRKLEPGTSVEFVGQLVGTPTVGEQEVNLQAFL